MVIDLGLRSGMHVEAAADLRNGFSAAIGQMVRAWLKLAWQPIRARARSPNKARWNQADRGLRATVHA